MSQCTAAQNPQLSFPPWGVDSVLLALPDICDSALTGSRGAKWGIFS